MKKLTKKEVQQRVLQNGKPLALSKFTWVEKTKTFSSVENYLVIDFNGISYCTFDTGSDCTFKTGSDCTFDTGSNCTFKTGYSCTFKTDSYCTFDTDYNCTFKTGSYCTFKTGDYCTFDTYSNCTFNTGSNCTFKTGYSCTFKTDFNCTFNTYNNAYIIPTKQSVLVVRKDNQKKIYDLDKYSNNEFIKFDLENTTIAKPIQTKYIDDGIYTINSSKQFNEYTIHNTQKIDEYFNKIDKFYTVAEKEYNNKTYYAHGINTKKAIEDLQFKIARENASLDDIAKAIKDKKNIINWYDYRLITGACEIGTLDWLERHNLNSDVELNIIEFYKEYDKEKPFGWDKFSEFAKEYFEV